jgi:hypothetical protein
MLACAGTCATACLAFVLAMTVISLLAVMVAVPKHAATAAQT